VSQLECALDPQTISQLRDLGEDDSFLADLFDAYAEQARTHIARMHGAVRDGDRVTFRRSAHAIAGSSLNIGATAVARICRSAESALANESALPEPAHLAAIEDEFKRAMAAMANVLG
jgi:HPt (histidine-containing phosphotransfer) domain-containing protein